MRPAQWRCTSWCRVVTCISKRMVQ